MKWQLVVAAVLVGILAGCSGGNKGTEVAVNPSSAPNPIQGELKVALLTPGSVNDSGWSSIAYEGLKAIEKELGAKVANQVTKDATIADAQRTFAKDGYQLVIGHGFEYNEPGTTVAKEFPATTFVSSSGGATSANSGAFRFYLEQGFYLAGVIAGGMSKTGKVAMIGGPEVPSIKSTFKAFAAGAKAARPDIVVIEKFTGKNDDVAAAKLATLQAISEGADYLIHQVNNAYAGFFGACEEKKVYAFGANYDQNSLSPVCIASAVIKPSDVFVKLAKRIKEGTYRGKIELVGMADGAIEFKFNPKLIDKVNPETRKLVDATQLKILAGEFQVPKDEF